MTSTNIPGSQHSCLLCNRPTLACELQFQETSDDHEPGCPRNSSICLLLSVRQCFDTLGQERIQKAVSLVR